MSSPTPESFLSRWRDSGASERANYQLFLSELCDLLDVPRPDPSGDSTAANAYVFERAVTFVHSNGDTRPGFIDLYKRGCFVLEAKQGADRSAPASPALSDALRELQKKRRAGTATRGTAAWDDAMLRARGQAELYLRALPPDEGRPPFVLVVDVGHSIELYSEFSRTGGAYIPFPAPGAHRIPLADLAKPEIRERLRLVWTAPLDLDPARRSARVTREIADRLAQLARLLEQQGHPPEAVATFLMRCLFTMFAEDVALLPRGAFSSLLDAIKDHPDHFVPLVSELWDRMNRGGFSTTLRANILQFNGGLFANPAVLPLDRDQIHLLLEASRSDWRDVEPAIFGTLLERALDPVERHQLGAHYTPRAYVERLVLPTLVQPVRDDWDTTRAAAITQATAGDLKKAAATVRAFHQRLVHLRVLDPACGSGNFLYVALEHLKRVEGEVFDFLDSLGERQSLLDLAGETVDPHQFLGIEINPRAAAIAELVLWIGTLQWHYRNRGSVHPPQPIIRNFHNIENRDALLDCDRIEPLPGPDGQPLTRWDGRTTKPHPVTGRDVPDESARVPVLQYINPRPAQWPRADYIIGNPPFIGPAMMRQALGDGYTETVRAAHPQVGDSSDFVMYWWDHAARLVRFGQTRRFGFVTTNSLKQKFNRRVLETHLGAAAFLPPVPSDKAQNTAAEQGGKNAAPPSSPLPALSLLFAIPDHPWVDSADGAAVRIAMTACGCEEIPGLLQTVTSETPGEDAYTVTLQSQRGRINPDLTIGADVSTATQLKANSDISNRGFELGNAGFIVTAEEAKTLLADNKAGESCIRIYRNGKDLAARPREVMAIDLFGLSEDEVRRKAPSIYQWLVNRVKPEREQNRDERLRREWWLHRRSREDLRDMLAGLPRFIATVETSKHRFFTFLDASILPDNKLINIALDDAYFLGVLSSRIHVAWALQSGSHLGVGNDPVYVKTACFETFPFPLPTESQKSRIRDLAEQLDAHRKRQLAQHADLTMTGMYNVLEKLRSGDPLTAKERMLHEHGLVSVLRQLHDDLDAAVFAAYAWPPSLSAPDLLTRLVALNATRAAEESSGLIRHLRPDYQSPLGPPPSLAAPPPGTPISRLTTPATEAAAATKESGDGTQESGDRDQASADQPPGKRPRRRKSPVAKEQGGKSPAPPRSSLPASSPAPRSPLPASSPLPAPRSSLPAPQPWPADLPSQVAAIKSLLPLVPHPPTPELLAPHFLRTKPSKIAPILEALKVMGVV